MSGFTKLDSGIVDSSIWAEPAETRVVWITLLAKSDKTGYARLSLSGLQRAANVPMEAVQKALLTLTSPDPDSRTSAEEGRRILKVDGGWFVVNYEKHRKGALEDAAREFLAAKKREERSNSTAKMSRHVADISASASASVSVPVPSLGKCENLFFGRVPPDLLDMAGSLMPSSSSAVEWQSEVQLKVESLGYSVSREVPCESSVGPGRIALVAEKGGDQVAIELDWRTPRHKSVEKVKTLPAGMVLLRDPRPIPQKNQESKWLTEARTVIHFMNETLSRQFRETAANLTAIRSRFNEGGVTLEGVKQMILRQKTLWGSDPKMSEYLRIETLFAKSKFDSYYAARELPARIQNGSLNPARPTAAQIRNQQIIGADDVRRRLEQEQLELTRRAAEGTDGPPGS